MTESLEKVNACIEAGYAVLSCTWEECEIAFSSGAPRSLALACFLKLTACDFVQDVVHEEGSAPHWAVNIKGHVQNESSLAATLQQKQQPCQSRFLSIITAHSSLASVWLPGQERALFPHLNEFLPEGLWITEHTITHSYLQLTLFQRRYSAERRWHTFTVTVNASWMQINIRRWFLRPVLCSHFSFLDGFLPVSAVGTGPSKCR